MITNKHCQRLRKLQEVTLWWNSIPSRRDLNATGILMLQKPGLDLVHRSDRSRIRIRRTFSDLVRINKTEAEMEALLSFKMTEGCHIFCSKSHVKGLGMSHVIGWFLLLARLILIHQSTLDHKQWKQKKKEAFWSLRFQFPSSIRLRFRLTLEQKVPYVYDFDSASKLFRCQCGPALTKQPCRCPVAYMYFQNTLMVHGTPSNVRLALYIICCYRMIRTGNLWVRFHWMGHAE